jgi:hypothetical protein
MQNPPAVIKSAFESLENGGWLEFQDPTMPVLCIDDSMNGTALQEWMDAICRAGEALGRKWTNSKNYKKWMEEIGFVNVVEKRFSWALNPWPKGKHNKLVAMWMQQDLLDGLQGLSMALLTRGLGWSREQVELLLVEVRKDVLNRGIHAYLET